jgi:hypothetical protein
MLMDYQAKYAAFRAAKIIELFGPPPILGTESLGVYEKILAGLGEDFAPRSTAEMMLVRDFADVSWEIFRYRRYKVLLLERRVRQLRETQAQREKARARIGEGSRQRKAEDVDQPRTKLERMEDLEDVAANSIRDVDEILAKGAEELEYARAFESAMKQIQMIEMMENFKAAERESILRQLALFKDGWGGHLRHVWCRLEREYQEANQQPNQHEIPTLPFSEAAE